VKDMSKLIGDLSKITNRIRLNLSAKDASREKALPLCREVIRQCSNAIRAIHRQQFDRAGELLLSAHDLLARVKQAIIEHNELYNTGFVRDAQKEFAEGEITLSLVTKRQIPDPEKLGIESAAYLNGLGEAVGELRRYLLDSIRKGDLSRGEELLGAMDDIYSVLITIDFNDSITGGLRRTTDMVRGVLEKTRSDLTLVIRQKDLEVKLGSFEQNLK
jgi:translin